MQFVNYALKRVCAALDLKVGIEVKLFQNVGVQGIILKPIKSRT